MFLTISHEIAKYECFIDINKTHVEKCVFGEYRAERVKT